MRVLQMQLKKETLIGLMIFLSACAHNTILRPLNDQLQKIKKGDPAPFDGYVMTANYFQTVGDVKIEKSKP
jgi:hypothetical protein